MAKMEDLIVEFVGGKRRKKRRKTTRKITTKRARRGRRRNGVSASMKMDKMIKEGAYIGAGIIGAAALVRLAKTQWAMTEQTASMLPLAAGLLLPQVVKGKQARQLRPVMVGALGVGIASLIATAIKEPLKAQFGETPVLSVGAGYDLMSRGNYQLRRPDLRSRIR